MKFDYRPFLAKPVKPAMAGFTLLEIMLVIMLMGLASTAVVMTMPSNSGYKSLKLEAQRLAGFIEVMSDQALMTSRELGIVVEEQRYQFVFYDVAKKLWFPLPAGKFNTEVTLPEDMKVTLTLSGFVWDDRDEQEELFEDESVFDEPEEPIIPQIHIMSSGEITPFVMRFSPTDEDNKLWIELQVKMTGDLAINEEPEE
ncbi:MULTISPECIES: type II secretion system minor pseudopilin GspH [unclassified Motilimonas]|uniref:type II secretion system minor pseudopilin GspH n=1 Tax=Motilimonas TaxID=1914248 RepID=UPI001E28C6F8|nr:MULTISPECIES: type II secretion system minor pseudopilin GspH [unclassified Motilimonas]MCE0557369.1 type II secretion system minor pseudopilin GspH [Motilimonas sp. E26]MDO6527357.1 type II secretion system minor pseudopilin GspH [Motilimonas sp. 1_MG-2023]